MDVHKWIQQLTEVTIASGLSENENLEYYIKTDTHKHIHPYQKIIELVCFMLSAKDYLSA